MLVAQGLYPPEANAMIETWRSSWFEEGTRLLYVVPPRTVDAVLPLQIDPMPAHVARVFVGRLELATGAALADITAAARTNDRTKLEKYGRFVRPFVERVLAHGVSARNRARIEALMVEAASPVSDADTSACQ